MDESDFAMTYPCFVLLHETRAPVTCNAEGDDALLLFTDEDSLDRFIQHTQPQGRIGRATIGDSDSLNAFLAPFENQVGRSGRTLSHLLVDATPDSRARCYPITSFREYLRRIAAREKPGLDVFGKFDQIAQLGQSKLQEVCHKWLLSPVAKECGISRLEVTEELRLLFNVTAEHEPQHGEEIYFPLDRLLYFIVDEALSDHQREATRHAIGASRATAGTDSFQKFRIDKGSVRPKIPLFLKCKTESCRNPMQTQFRVHRNERIKGGPFHVTCPKCGCEHDYDDGDFRFRDEL